MSKDRFDLESAIMDVWAIKDQVNKLRWRMYDHPELLSERCRKKMFIIGYFFIRLSD